MLDEFTLEELEIIKDTLENYTFDYKKVDLRIIENIIEKIESKIEELENMEEK